MHDFHFGKLGHVMVKNLISKRDQPLCTKDTLRKSYVEEESMGIR